jgi:hypothetical protein
MFESDPKPWPFDSSVSPIVICKAWVEKVNTKGRLDHRLLYCNEAFASLYKEKTFTKDIQPSRSFKWFQITKISLMKTDVLEMQFQEGEIIIKHNDAKEIGEVIINHVLSIIGLETEILIEFPGFSVEEFQPCDEFLMMRYRARVFGFDREISLVALNILSKCSHNFKGVVDFTSFRGDSSIVDDMLFALLIDSRAKFIKMPRAYREHSLWAAFARFLRYNEYLQAFSIAEIYDDSFELLASNIENNEESQLEEMGFIGTKFPIEGGKFIKRILKARKIKALSFNKAVRGDFMEFMDEFASDKSFKNITNFSVSGQKLKINELLMMCSKVNELTLVRVGLDMSEILAAIDKNEQLRLTRLNISKNPCKKKVPISTDFGGAGVIIMDKAIFTVQAIVSLIAAIGESGEPASISFAYATLEAGEWKTVFTQLKELKNISIGELIWDGNKITPSFFTFVNRIKTLTALSLMGAQILEGPSTKKLCSFIEGSTKLKYLNVSGKKGNNLSSSSAADVIKALESNRSISYFDISNTPIRPNGLRNLANALITNRVPDIVLIDTIKVYTRESWNYFIDTLLKRGKPLKIVWSEEEIRKMADQKIINEKDIDEFKKNIARIEKGDSSIEIPPESITKQVEKPNISTPDSDQTDIDRPDVMTAGFSGIVVPLILLPPLDDYITKFSLSEILNRVNSK